MNKIKLFLLLSIVTLFCSCSQKIMDFTLISSKKVDLSKAASFVKGEKKIMGKKHIYMIVMIPTGKFSIDKALDRAIESVPGCVALVDGTVRTSIWMIPCVFYQQTITIEGTPIIDPGVGSYSNEVVSYSKIELDKKGAIKKIETISSSEYDRLKNDIVKDSNVIKFNNSTSL